MHISIGELLGTECPNTIDTTENCVHCLRCLRPLFYIGDCRACSSSRRCLSNDFVRLLSETSVASFDIISFFLLQRSLSSHVSSHLFTVTSKFCNRVKSLLLTFLYVMQFYNTFCCLSLGLYLLQTMQNLSLSCMTSQSSTSTLNFNFFNCKESEYLEIFLF